MRDKTISYMNYCMILSINNIGKEMSNFVETIEKNVILSTKYR